MAAILTVLEELGAPVYRTKLVKLIYLADNLFCEHFGGTISGLGYMWDDFGPNAISNAIVKEADKLVAKDFVCMKVGKSIYGSENYLYSLGPMKSTIPVSLLSPLEQQVLRDTVERYRKTSVMEIVAVSKRTKPFKAAKQYQLLSMNQSAEYQTLLQAVRSDSQLMAAIREDAKPEADAGSMPLQEVKRRYGI